MAAYTVTHAVGRSPRAPARRISAAVSEDGPGSAGVRSVDVVLGYEPRVDFRTGLADTVEWYRTQRGWWEPLKQAG